MDIVRKQLFLQTLILLTSLRAVMKWPWPCLESAKAKQPVEQPMESKGINCSLSLDTIVYVKTAEVVET